MRCLEPRLHARGRTEAATVLIARPWASHFPASRFRARHDHETQSRQNVTLAIRTTANCGPAITQADADCVPISPPRCGSALANRPPPRFVSSGSNAPYVSRCPWRHSAIEADGGPPVARPTDRESLATPRPAAPPVNFASLGAPRFPSLPRSQPPRPGKLEDYLTCLRREADSGGN